MNNGKICKYFYLQVLLLMVLLSVTGCSGDDASTLPTPDLDILAPTATALTARIEVVVVVVTPTAAPTATPAPAPQPSDDEGADVPEESAQATPMQGAQMSNQQLINAGEQVYAGSCASCHQSNGAGTSAYPALDNSALLTADDASQAIELVLHGRGEMPGFEDDLSNRQIAAVLSYTRNAWGNDAPVVRVAQVRQARRGQSADAGTEAATTTTMTATVTASITATVTAVTAETTTPVGTASPTPADEATAESATSIPAEQETPPATWTPARAVTPLLPTVAGEDEDAETPLPEATVTTTE